MNPIIESEKVFFVYGETNPSPRTNKTRRVCIAGVVNGTVLEMGVSQCSPEDQFKKQTARTIAMGRMGKHPMFRENIYDDKTGSILPVKEIVDLMRAKIPTLKVK